MRAALALSLVLLVSCEQEPRPPAQPVEWTVIDRQYVPDTRKEGFAPGISMSGKIHFTYMSTGRKEAYVLILRHGDEVKSQEVTALQYAQTKVGDKVMTP